MNCGLSWVYMLILNLVFRYKGDLLVFWRKSCNIIWGYKKSSLYSGYCRQGMVYFCMLSRDIRKSRLLSAILNCWDFIKHWCLSCNLLMWLLRLRKGRVRAC